MFFLLLYNKFCNFIIKVAKKLEENENEPVKIYGNPFLGPNLWNKDELIQSEKFGVRFEYLDVQEFLAENEMENLDFLGEIEKPSVSNNLPQQQCNNNINNDCLNGLLVESRRSVVVPNHQFNFNATSSSSLNNNDEIQGIKFIIKSPLFM